MQRATLLGLLRVNDLTPYLSASLPRFFFSLRVKTNGRPGGARAFTPSARCAQGGQGGRRARQRRPALRGIVAIGMPVITRRRREDDGEPATPPNQARPNKTARGQSQEPFATPATQPPPALPPPTTASPTAVDQAPTPSADHDQEIVATSPPAAARPELADDAVSDEEFFYQLVGDLDPAELRGELQAYPANAEGADAQPLALPDAAVPANTPAHFVQILEAAQGQLPEAARAAMIVFFKKVIADATALPPGTKLVQCGISPPIPGSSFPHLVEFNGAQSAEDEACQWQQYKSRMTVITVKLLDAQGAPPPRPCPI